MKGTVKFFNNMRGFGFIAGEDGKEYFVQNNIIPSTNPYKQTESQNPIK